MVEESIRQIVAFFDCTQGVACHRCRPETREDTHGRAAAEVWPQPWIVAEYRPCFLYRTNSQFRAINELAQSRPDGVGFLTEASELVGAHPTHRSPPIHHRKHESRARRH
jgi:hypothetical protein